MNKKILLGLLVAGVGVTASIGSAYALYVKSPTAIDINIGAHTTGDVNLHIVNNEGASPNVIAPDKDRAIDFDFDFTTATGSQYTQDVFLSKLDITVTCSTHALAAAMKADSTFEMNGYVGYWASNNTSEKAIATGTEDTYTTFGYSGFAPVYKRGNETVIGGLLTLSCKSQTDAQFVALAEATYSVSVNISEVLETEYDFAYIRGVNGWDVQNVYQMVPNPKGENFEWMYQTTTTEGKSNNLSEGQEFKAYKYDTKTSEDVWSGPSTGNEVMKAENRGKLILWSGGSGVNVSYYGG